MDETVGEVAFMKSRIDAENKELQRDREYLSKVRATAAVPHACAPAC
jgi:hypothetical protein